MFLGFSRFAVELDCQAQLATETFLLLHSDYPSIFLHGRDGYFGPLVGNETWQIKIPIYLVGYFSH